MVVAEVQEKACAADLINHDKTTFEENKFHY
jgi:hypothetical protein